jgi:general secretion pathway protein A
VALLEHLAAEAASGFARSPWGGVEFGGILLGTRKSTVQSVDAVRPIACEHEYGPSFHLSAKDGGSLEALLATLRTSGSEVLGWYRTTSRELSLSSDDCNLARRYFGEPWQVTLLLQRGKQVAPRFGLFGRSEDGADSSLIRSFTMAEIEPLLSPPDPPELPSPIEQTAAPLPVEPPSTAPANEPAGPLQPDRAAVERLAVERIYVELPGTILPDGHSAHQAERGSLPQQDAADESNSVHMDAERDARSGWLGFFGFREEPFSSTQDPAKYYPSPQHREALAALEYGIESRKGLVVLTGESGVGKTFLLHCLADRLKRSETDFARVFNSRISPLELFETLAYDLRFPGTESKMAALFALHERAVSCAERGRTVAVLIDDAHRLDEAVLEEIEALGNIESRRGKLVQLVLAGRPELDSRLDLPNLRGLRQRIALRATLGPFSPVESAGYMGARLMIAAGLSPKIISPEVMERIHGAASGVPRVINTICTVALERAAMDGQPEVTVPILENALEQLGHYSPGAMSGPASIN